MQNMSDNICVNEKTQLMHWRGWCHHEDTEEVFIIQLSRVDNPKEKSSTDVPATEGASDMFSGDQLAAIADI